MRLGLIRRIVPLSRNAIRGLGVILGCRWNHLFHAGLNRTHLFPCPDRVIFSVLRCFRPGCSRPSHHADLPVSEATLFLHWVPSDKAAACLGSRSPRFWVPQKMGQKKETFSCPTDS